VKVVRRPNLEWGKFSLEIGARTFIMGILNRTPDSFSDGGKFFEFEDALGHAMRMAQDGADIIDIGGESTRPGSSPVTASEEIERVVPLISELAGRIDVPISVDTSKSEVALEALKCGASIINDITGLRGDSKMAEVAARFDVPVVLMHIKGTPREMQRDPTYNDLIPEILGSLKGSIELAESAGVDPGKIIVDPGIGFGKTLEHNLAIIKGLEEFKALEKPILIGTSRKSFIGAILSNEADDRLMGTAASVALAIANGADMVRVHDIKEIREVARVADAICRN